MHNALLSPAFRKTHQARRITVLAPNPPYQKTGFHFAVINNTLIIILPFFSYPIEIDRFIS